MSGSRKYQVPKPRQKELHEKEFLSYFGAEDGDMVAKPTGDEKVHSKRCLTP